MYNMGESLNITLGEMCQSQKDKCCMTHKLIEIKKSGGFQELEKNVGLMHIKFQFCKMKKVLEMMVMISQQCD